MYNVHLGIVTYLPHLASIIDSNGGVLKIPKYYTERRFDIFTVS